MGEVGDVDVAPFRVDAFAQPGIVLLGGAAEVPVGELEIRRVAEKFPADDAAGIDEVNFQVLRIGDFFQVEARLGEAAQRIQRAALQQFGERAFQRDFEARMRAEAGEAALVVRD